jgi:hypothetical protein
MLWFVINRTFKKGGNKMNIYALPGFQVKVKTWVREIDSDLRPGTVYTVERTEVYGFHTEVYLKEIPGQTFSNEIFDDVSSQTVNENSKHPDWHKYKK